MGIVIYRLMVKSAMYCILFNQIVFRNASEYSIPFTWCLPSTAGGDGKTGRLGGLDTGTPLHDID